VKLLGWMRTVPPRQTFGVRAACVETLGCDPSQVAVKCGWDMHADETAIRTHAALTAPLPGGDTASICVLTAFPLTDNERRNYMAAYGTGEEVLGLHHKLAAAALAEQVQQLLARL
jgi:hypothetical protein